MSHIYHRGTTSHIEIPDYRSTINFFTIDDHCPDTDADSSRKKYTPIETGYEFVFNHQLSVLMD